MNKIYFLVLVLFFGFGATAQTVNIPDANFKATLLAASPSNGIARINGTSVQIDTNNDGEIQLSEAQLIDLLSIQQSGISDLTGLESFSNLAELNADSNNFASLVLSGLPLLSRISLSDMPNLQALDLSGTGVNSLFANNDTSLISIAIKNGKISYNYGVYPVPGYGGVYFNNSPNLQYVCVDNGETNYIQAKVNALGYNTEVNSYCSFTPGGAFYTIAGNARFDSDDDGCTIFDFDAANMKFIVSSGPTSAIIFSDDTGAYNIPVQAGNYTISPVHQYPFYFNATGSAVVDFPAAVSPNINDFCFSPNGVHPDLEIFIMPITAAVPGFDAGFKIVYRNNGTMTQSGNIVLQYDDYVTDYVSSDPVFTSQEPYLLSWDFSDLKPFESRQILLKLNLNSPNDDPALVGGELIFHTVNINSNETDETPNDNNLSLYQTVVNAVDPNNKTCLQGENMAPELAGTYVHYVIRFENTGTANAQNVVVKDIIDTTKFNIGSLVPLDGSHPFTTRITDTNKVEFIFENIQLPFDDANNDGYVAFKIRTLPTLAAGTVFSNKASIYFDFNAPADTNTASTILQLLGTDDFGFDNYFTLYPNPANDVLNLKAKQNIQLTSVSVYNALGQLVLAVRNPTDTIDIAKLAAGNYFIKVHTDKGIANVRFLKK